MTEHTNPMDVLFRMQRASMDGTRRFLQESMDAQRSAWTAAMDAVTAGEETRNRGFEVNRRAVHAAVDALERSAPVAGEADALHRAVDDQFDTMERVGRDAWETYVDGVEASLAAADEASRTYLDLLDRAVEQGMAATREFEDAATAE